MYSQWFAHCPYNDWHIGLVIVSMSFMLPMLSYKFKVSRTVWSLHFTSKIHYTLKLSILVKYWPHTEFKLVSFTLFFLIMQKKILIHIKKTVYQYKNYQKGVISFLRKNELRYSITAIVRLLFKACCMHWNINNCITL